MRRRRGLARLANSAKNALTSFSGARQMLASLALVAVASVVAGVFLGANADRLEEFPGLLLMVPAAIALRGNIFGAMGSRLGTAIHAGTYRFSFRPSSVVGENILSSLLLNLLASLALALLGKVFALVFGIADTIALSQFIAISVTGGFLASLVVLAAALGLTALSVRYRWDPDNITAPLVTSAADLITLPALFATVWFIDIPRYATALTAIFAGLTVLATGAIWRGATKSLKRVLAESSPVLVTALALDMFAGIAAESRLGRFADYPSLLVLLPGYLAIAGSLGGILTSRLSTKLHLGIASPSRLPERSARDDMLAIAVLALPGYLLLVLAAQASVETFGFASPGFGSLMGITLLGGALVTALVVAVGYYTTMATVRVGLNPDTYGIPIITSVLDLIGAFVLILVLDLLI